MKSEEDKNLDILISKSLNDKLFPNISDSFTDRLMQKIQAKVTWKMIMAEFFSKVGLVIVLLCFAAGVLFIPQFGNFLKLLTGLTAKWQIIVNPIIIIAFTLIVDQIVLKYLISKRNIRA